MLTLIYVCVFVGFAVLVWAVVPTESMRLIRKRIYTDVGAKKRPSLLGRLVKLLAPLHRKLPLTLYCDQTTKSLESAGLRLPPLLFLVIQEMSAFTGLLVYAVLTWGKPLNLVWLVGFVAVWFFIPILWMNNRRQARRMTVSRDLPEVVDLLTLAVGAGSDFMSALGRITREFRPCPVREELAILLQEVRVGKRRRDSLRGFATRLHTPEANTFARTLIQVDRMGTGMDEALTILSEDMRLQRYHWAERFAQQAPMKMLLPLILSLGSAMMIVAGPILVQFLRGGFSTNMTAQGQSPR